MVDEMVAMTVTRSAPQTAETSQGKALTITVGGSTPALVAAYAGAASQSSCAPAQSDRWIRTWLETVGPDAIIATISKDGESVLALALEVERRGPFRVARLIGGSHANGNWVPGRFQKLGEYGDSALRELLTQIRTARRDVDVVLLERLIPETDGTVNPLLSLPSNVSPNPSLAVDLSGGFEEVLARSSGKRKRKKHRSQTRKFEAAGGFQRIEASSPEQVERILDSFFAMKAIRFQQAGIANVFADPKVQDFFRRLFVDALPVTPRPFVLHALEVGGKLRAITGSSRVRDRVICEFGAIIEDELAHASPGDFLFFENIKEACSQGFAVYDFSVGDELYKRLWCDIETHHRDVIIPFSTKGKVLAKALSSAARVKAWIKSNERLWKFVKALRRRGAGQQAPAQSSDD